MLAYKIMKIFCIIFFYFIVNYKMGAKTFI